MNIFINFETGGGVMMFFENKILLPRTVEYWAKQHFPDVIEAYEVKDEELQYYIYEPVYMTDEKVDKILKGLKAEREEKDEWECSDTPTITESLRNDVVSGKKTLRDAAVELHESGWSNYILDDEHTKVLLEL